MTEATKTWAEVTASNDKFRRLVKYSGIPVNTYDTHRLYKFLPGKGASKGHAECVRWLSEPDHHFLTLGGDPGRGKTHLALGIGWHWMENDLGVVKYWRVSDLLDSMRREYDIKPETEQGWPMKTVFEKTKEADLLILDDLGAEKDTAWVTEKLDDLIDYRWFEKLPTVFTTNLLFSQLPPRLASRLKEGVIVLLEGPDYREYKARMRRDKG